MNDTSLQLNLFECAQGDERITSKKTDDTVVVAHEWRLYIDGASRNNPGKSGAGVYIMRDGIPLYQEGYFLGIKTNNQAEYLALLLGLFTLKQWYNKRDKVLVYSDSQLLVRQVQGMYKVRNELLKPLHAIAQVMIKDMHVTIAHVMREDNTHADKMANHGIDTQKPMPPVFIRMLKQYDVAL